MSLVRDGLRLDNSCGELPVFTAATLPDPATLPVGAEVVLGENLLTAFCGLYYPTSNARIVTVIASPGVDCISEIQQKIAYLATLGGGILNMPMIGGSGYSISNRIEVNTSNIVILLNDNITLTKTTVDLGPGGVTNSYDGAIVFRGTTSAYIDNVGIIAPRRVKIDCNGRNVTGFNWDAFAGGQYGGVQFTFCRNTVLKNIYVYNSLTFGIQSTYALGGVWEDCAASDNMHENGIQAGFNGDHIIAPDELNPASWANIRIIRPMAWNCKNHGVGSYGAIGVYVNAPKIWNCGNNTGAQQAGPAGGLNVEHDGVNISRNYRFLADNVEITGSYGFGIRTNCIGTTVTSGTVRKVKIPTAYSSDPSYDLWGCGVFVQGASDATISVDISDCEYDGIRMQNAGTLYPSLKFRGNVSNCTKRAIAGYGINSLITYPENVYTKNGQAAGGYTSASPAGTIEVWNGGANSNAGYAKISGRFDGNYRSVAVASAIANPEFVGISGHNNLAGYASAFHAIYFNTVLNGCAVVRDINLTSNNSLQSRVAFGDGTIQKCIVDRGSVNGDQTSTNKPRADITAIDLIGDIVANAAPSSIPYYVGQRYIDLTNKKEYVSVNRSVVSDWVLLN